MLPHPQAWWFITDKLWGRGPWKAVVMEASAGKQQISFQYHLQIVETLTWLVLLRFSLGVLWWFSTVAESLLLQEVFPVKVHWVPLKMRKHWRYSNKICLLLFQLNELPDGHNIGPHVYLKHSFNLAVLAHLFQWWKKRLLWWTKYFVEENQTLCQGENVQRNRQMETFWAAFGKYLYGWNVPASVSGHTQRRVWTCRPCWLRPLLSSVKSSTCKKWHHINDTCRNHRKYNGINA